MSKYSCEKCATFFSKNHTMRNILVVYMEKK